MAATRALFGASLLLACTLITALGCTTVVVKKDPGHHDRGIRFCRPKPYLYIGPVAQPAQSSPQQKDNTTPAPGGTAPAAKPATGTGAPANQSATGTVTDNNFIKVGMELKYLPDYNEEYSIRLKPGIGTGTLGVTLADGWNLTTVNMQTDQKLPELLSSIASLIGAVKGTGAGGGGSTGGAKARTPSAVGEQLPEEFNVVVDSRPDVPLGFYEAVIATGPDGRKSLFGWRYVGFMPFVGCPVEPCAEPKTISCGPNDLWGIVATPNSIKFQKLSDIGAGPLNAWPYKYKSVKGPSAREAEKGDAPPIGFTFPESQKPSIEVATTYLKETPNQEINYQVPAYEHPQQVRVEGYWRNQPVTVVEFKDKNKMPVYVVIPVGGQAYGPFSSTNRPDVTALIKAALNPPKDP